MTLARVILLWLLLGAVPTLLEVLAFAYGRHEFQPMLEHKVQHHRSEFVLTFVAATLLGPIALAFFFYCSVPLWVARWKHARSRRGQS